MGIYDRDYERDDRYGGYGHGGGYGGGGVHLRFPQSTINRIVLVTLVAYVVELLFNQPSSDPRVPDGNLMINALGLQSQWWRQPWQAYQLLTYALVHANENILHVLGNMFGVWMFGRELEQRFGSREILYYYIGSILIGGLAITLGDAIQPSGVPTIGASAGTVAVIVLFALLYPHRRVFLYALIPIPMWVIGVFIVGGDLLGAFGGRGGNIAFEGHLGGAAFALFYYFQRPRLSRLTPENVSMPSLKRRPKLRVHHEEPSEQVDEFSEEVDRILRKIKSEGADSLTRHEKRVLERASRQYQKRNR